MIYRIGNTVLVILLIFLRVGYAGITTDTSSAPKTANSVRITPLPVIMYSPETRLGIGALGILNFSLGKDSLTRSSYLQSSVIITINKQIDTDNMLVAFTNEEKYLIKGRFRYMHMPEFYYGVGNSLPESNRQLVTYNRLLLELKALRRISNKDFAGIFFRSNSISKTRPEGEGIWQQQPYVGQAGYRITGIGIDLTRDKRDLVYNASKGYSIDFSFIHYGKTTLSDFNLNNYFLDVRKYFTVWKKKRHIFCFQSIYNGMTGTVPYKDLSELGGPMIMRGYYRGRARDKNMLAFQMEYRLPVWKFLGLTAWAGGACVDPEFLQVDFTNWKPNYGIGTRVQINKKDRINIRFDVGFGKNSSGFYVDILEAF
jgi:hypothetical protein